MILLLLLCSPAYAEEWIASAYCPCIKCCGKTDGITASGIKAKPNHTVAVNWLPFGTVLKINGKKYYVEDRGARSVFGDKLNHKKRLDIFFASHKEALNFGKQKVEVGNGNTK